MDERYRLLENMLPTGGHFESPGAAGRFMSVEEAQAMGIDVSDIVENSGVPGEGVDEPKEQNTHIGVRMPGSAKPPADVRPQYAYNSDGTLVGWVQARIVPTREEAPESRYGALPQFDILYCGQRTYPQGIKDEFDSESEAKKYVANGDKVKWYRPDTPDPWESMSDVQRGKAARFLAEDIVRGDLDGGKFERYAGRLGVLPEASAPRDRSSDVSRREARESVFDRAVHRVLEAEGDGNPWAICTASVGRDDEDKYERCVQDVKKKNRKAGRPAEGE